MSVRRRPWEELPEVWKTEASFLSWLRGGIRRAMWMRHPVKLEFIKNNSVEMVNTNPRSMKRFPTVKGAQCSKCGEVKRAADMEVDHRTGEFSLRSIEDLQRFIEGVVLVGMDDLAWLCKPCHEIKTHMERQGFHTWGEAQADKEAIAIGKKGVNVVKAWLKERGVEPGTTAAKRRDQIFAILKEEYK
ncbi:hypothetical protein [Pseudomonas phage PH826]|uniref:HNH endonuclease n=7 Tax=Nankokuvirus TaxID=1925779 RepID=A0A6G9LER7_9CAUD|nr:HNH endonuclease [Pseudomonas phage PAK_P5]YP_008858084.1 HNH endonuclease [Pseudomonas phage CHA_P1]QEM40986.1 hypothetical protein PAPJP_060 [Pseudomonas phage PAP-JP]QIQ63842.1 hypothetical protein Epa24_00106 [Pseudomonas phage Epa24]QIQ64095.1 hypothetical protein Epa17_00051 [Pseudomonas phage Epa17]QIQ64989.1 hypothetical protein 16_00133 [Pseudomonas phage Epa16]QIQ65622.1 hypothetical protein 26_00065 [Pseudomonas phage Epa26]UKH48085.1 MAG: hypothetical protein [Pseudomonas phag